MITHEQISYNPEPSVIGVRNGVFQLEIDEKHLKKNKNYKNLDSLLFETDGSNFEERQNNYFDLDRISFLKGKMLKRAKFTDLMVFSPYIFGMNYIISQKFLDCIIDINVPLDEYRTFKIEIEKAECNYYLLFVPMIPAKEIIFFNSLLFPESERILTKKKYYEVENYSDYLDLIEKKPLASFEKICLNKRYQSLHIIYSQGSADLFFSISLIQKLKAEKISGLVANGGLVELSFG